MTSGQLVKHYRGDYGNMMATITLVYLVGMAVIWLAPGDERQAAAGVGIAGFTAAHFID